MCKHESEEEGEEEPEQYAEAPAVHYVKRKRVRAPMIDKNEKGQEAVESPTGGVKMPGKTESLKKDRQGKYAVVAVRTFPEAECPDSPAGSIWLSSDDA